jgi:hypothetical protein
MPAERRLTPIGPALALTKFVLFIIELELVMRCGLAACCAQVAGGFQILRTTRSDASMAGWSLVCA